MIRGVIARWFRAVRRPFRYDARFPFPLLAALRERQMLSWYRRKALRMGYGTPLRLAPLRERRRSDTLFLLGTGASINRLSSEQWDEIGRGDSMGVNYWPVHDFVPTYYVFEVPAEPHRRESLHALLELRGGAYERTTVILKHVWRNEFPFLAWTIPPSYRERILIDTPITIPPIGNREPKALRSALEQLRRSGLTQRHPLYRTGSMSYMATLGALIGYRDIVFCGNDLRHTQCFFDEQRHVYVERGIPLPTSIQKGSTHATLAGGAWTPSILDVLELVQEVVCGPRGVRFSVSDDESPLRERFPRYAWGAGIIEPHPGPIPGTDRRAPTHAT